MGTSIAVTDTDLFKHFANRLCGNSSEVFTRMIISDTGATWTATADSTSFFTPDHPTWRVFTFPAHGGSTRTVGIITLSTPSGSATCSVDMSTVTPALTWAGADALTIYHWLTAAGAHYTG